MKYWKVETKITQKNGSKRQETNYVQSEEKPEVTEGTVIEIPRMPEYAEDFVDNKFVKNKELERKEKEQSRLQRLSRREIKEEILSEIFDKLFQAGIITQEQMSLIKEE